MSQALYRKYRPSTFKDVTGQSHIVKTLQNEIRDDSVSHAYLFCGPRGVGKTTIARLLAKTVNCTGRKKDEQEACGQCAQCKSFEQGNAIDVIEMDAATYTKVENLRENIIEASRFTPTTSPYKIFIIDEVHMLSNSSFNALLKTLEEPPSFVIFILATTEAHKIPQTIVSRCQRFDFRLLTSEEIVKRLENILKEENASAQNEVLQNIARLSEGCLRDAESLLGQLMALGEKELTNDIASIVLPQTNSQTVSKILSACESRDASEASDILKGFIEQGGSVRHLLDDLIEESRQRMISSLGVDNAKTKLYSLYIEIFLKARSTISPDVIVQLPLEIAIVKICLHDQYESGVHDEHKEIVEKKDDAGGSVLNTKNTKHEEIKDDIDSVSECNIDVEELKVKWGRCCDEVAKKNIALPLALKHIIPIGIREGRLILECSRPFYFETMSQQKNLTLLVDAIEKIMQVRVNIKLELAKQEPDGLSSLVQAFGGTVVD